MTVAGQGPNSQAHLGYADSFSQDTGTQCIPSTFQFPPPGGPSHPIQDHFNTVSPSPSSLTTTHYTVTQMMNQPNVPVGPSCHDNQDFINAGVPSTTAADMNGMIPLIGSDLLGSSSVQRAQYHVNNALSHTTVASTFGSAPPPLVPMLHAPALTLTPTPTPPIPILLTSPQATVLSPGSVTAPTSPANSGGTYQGERPTTPGDLTEVTIRQPTEFDGTTSSAPLVPRMVNKASPSSVAKIIQTFQAALTPLPNMEAPSTCSAYSTKAAVCMDVRPRAQNVNQEDLPVMDISLRKEGTSHGLRHVTKKKKYCALVSWILHQGSLVRHPSLI